MLYFVPITGAMYSVKLLQNDCSKYACSYSMRRSKRSHLRFFIFRRRSKRSHLRSHLSGVGLNDHTRLIAGLTVITVMRAVVAVVDACVATHDRGHVTAGARSMCTAATVRRANVAVRRYDVVAARPVIWIDVESPGNCSRKALCC